jgi:type I restriction enzyme R subunit
MDFKKATELFRDDDFDGPPIIIYEPGPDDPPVPPDPQPYDDDPPDDNPESGESRKVYISGVSARIIAERIEYLGPDGTLITESYRDFTRKQIKSEFASLDDFLRSWNSAAKKQAILELLEDHGIVLDNLAEEVGKDYGDFDLICHIAYDQPPLTRKERANQVRKRNYFTKYGEQARMILTALLDKYADEGIRTIENARVLKLKPFSDIGTPMEIINRVFGGKENYENAIQELEGELYRQEQSA